MFNAKERQVLITLVSAEIMKSHLHYGCKHESTNVLYEIRNKLIKEDEQNEHS